MGLDIERSVRNLLSTILDVHLVLAKVIGSVGSLESTVSIVGYFNFARISIWALFFFGLCCKAKIEP